METRQRQEPTEPSGGSPGGEAPTPPVLRPQTAEAAAAGLAAIDQILARALSGDSEGFLRANRQPGGE